MSIIDDKTIKLFNKIDTVVGHCEECGDETILVALVQEFYRCTGCGADTKQHINGRIRYIQLSETYKHFIKEKATAKL